MPALTDLIGGQVQFYFGSISESAPLARAGKRRPIGVTGRKRSAVLPDMPTIDEAAIPGYDAEGWWGILAPARVPTPIVTSLNREIVAIVGAEETRRGLVSQGFEAAPRRAAAPEGAADELRRTR